VYGNNFTKETFETFFWAGFLGTNHIYGVPASWGAQIEFLF